MITNSSLVEYARSILAQGTVLDFSARPLGDVALRGARENGRGNNGCENGGKRGSGTGSSSVRKQVPAYKLDEAKLRCPWILDAEECHLLRDAFLTVTADDIIASGAGNAEPSSSEEFIASWIESCRSWASFLDECAALGGVSIDWLPEHIESW